MTGSIVSNAVIGRRYRTHVIEARELETFRRFVAFNGGNFIGYARENATDVVIAWFEPIDNPVDVSDFPTYRMI
jgi:hypothetical protein